MNRVARVSSPCGRHFVEPGGSLVCICTLCLRTLARGESESDLHLDVPEHNCPGDWRISSRAMHATGVGVEETGDQPRVVFCGNRNNQ